MLIINLILKLSKKLTAKTIVSNVGLRASGLCFTEPYEKALRNTGPALRDGSSKYGHRDRDDLYYERGKKDNAKESVPKRRGSLRRQSETKRAASTETKEKPLKSMLKKPRNLQPPSKAFMEGPERSKSLNRYNRYFNDPTFDPTERFKRAQERVDKLQKQVSSFEKNEKPGPSKMSEGNCNKKDNKKASKSSSGKNFTVEKHQKDNSSEDSKDNESDDDEDNESSRSAPRSVFQYLYDTDGRPLNQEAKKVQRELEEDYEEVKRHNLIPRTKT